MASAALKHMNNVLAEDNPTPLKPFCGFGCIETFFEVIEMPFGVHLLNPSVASAALKPSMLNSINIEKIFLLNPSVASAALKLPEFFNIFSGQFSS